MSSSSVSTSPSSKEPGKVEEYSGLKKRSRTLESVVTVATGYWSLLLVISTAQVSSLLSSLRKFQLNKHANRGERCRPFPFPLSWRKLGQYARVRSVICDTAAEIRAVNWSPPSLYSTRPPKQPPSSTASWRLPKIFTSRSRWWEREATSPGWRLRSST